ncbi:MAG: Calx-beta domain-containing protein [Aulosira sp. ZfuVER01]|nr:Calx-beta domain-containing protein [Aulosira sp. ZfuVER01]MDZ7997944.1 Calx-beta domain-containing protein [Aulosira sp. DedVER01a]MDZ8054665.1 Calx-beta domain-containing protein [Aulosira sp. ZfuCHP01]
MIINGTANQDELYAQKNDQLFGLEGDDILDSSNGQGNNLLDGGSGNDQLLGNNNDTLRGGIGGDSLFAVGSLGFNTLEGGEDNDRLFVVEGSNNNLDGGKGEDRLVVSDGNGYNTLFGGSGNDFLDASNPTGNNNLDGGEGDDLLIGGLASDRLFGGAGDDSLFAGTKGSQFTGGTGQDRFYIASAAIPEVPVEVFDFTKGEDKVVIAAIPQVQKFQDLTLEQILVNGQPGPDTSIKATINGELKELGILRNVQANSLTPDDFDFIVDIFSITNASAIEGQAIAFTVTRSGNAQSEQSVTVSTSIATTDTASNNDFTAKAETLVFKQGETSKTFTVQTTQDSLFEADETFTVSLSNSSNESIISSTNATAIGTITNDDLAPIFAIADASGVEGSAIAFTITRTGDAQAEESVTIFTSINTGDTASNDDFTAKTETLTFKQGETNKTFSVQTTTDSLAEGNETFSVSLNNPTNGATISPTNGKAKGNITDVSGGNDVGVTITQTDGSTKVTEGGAGDRYSVVLKSKPQADVTIAINTGKQIKASAKTLTFTAQNWNVEQEVTVTAIDDAIVEGNRSDTIQHTATSTDVNYNGIAINSIGVSITDNDIPLAKSADNDVFTIKGDGDNARLQVTLTGNSSKLVNELGVYVVDDAQGTINGIAPGAAGYAQAALERARVIFSAIANRPNGFSNNNLQSLLEFNSGENVRFYLVKNSTIDAVRSGITQITDVLFSSPTTQKITDLGSDGFSIAWQDGSGNSTNSFQDLVVKIKATNEPLSLGTNLQSKSQGELIDLRDVTKQVKADFVVNREAAFDNFVGFYQAIDENGGIDTNNDGKADILPGQASFTQAAIRGRVAGIDLTVNNQGTATYSGTFKPGAIFVPFIIINGRPDTVVDTNPNNDPAVYFPFLGANSDKTDHIRLLGNNIFGFEDLANGGDKDFNDVIVKLNLSIA